MDDALGMHAASTASNYERECLAQCVTSVGCELRLNELRDG